MGIYSAYSGIAAVFAVFFWCSISELFLDSNSSWVLIEQQEIDWNFDNSLSKPWSWLHFFISFSRRLCIQTGEVKWSCSVVSDSLRPHGHQAPLSMGFSRQEYWSGLPFLSTGNFPTQGLNPGLPHCRQMLYCLSHQRSHSNGYIFPFLLCFLLLLFTAICKAYSESHFAFLHFFFLGDGLDSCLLYNVTNLHQ